MKKKGYIGRLAAVALVLCMVTMSLTAGTLAKYVSDASGDAEAVVAAWTVKFTDDANNTYTGTTPITLKPTKADYVDTHLVADGKIAPEVKGSFALKVDGTGTEVAFKYKVELDLGNITETKATQTTGAPLKFFKDAACTQALTATGNKVAIEDEMLVNDTARVDTINVYWKWDSSAITITGKTAGDQVDTALGEEFDTFTIPVTIHAEQKTSTT